MGKMLKQPVMSKQEKKWEIEDALRTLQRAEEIRKNPTLMSGVKKSIVDLQKMAFGGSSKSSTSKKKK